MSKGSTRGAHTLATRVGGAHPYWACPPSSWAPWWPSGGHLLLYGVFRWEKNHKPSSRTKLRRHEAEPWRNQSRAPAELFCRGNFPPGGGNHRHCHHQRSSHRERAISIKIFISTISSQNPNFISCIQFLSPSPGLVPVGCCSVNYSL